jgi:hypothetical protein
MEAMQLKGIEFYKLDNLADVVADGSVLSDVILNSLVSWIFLKEGSTTPL